MGTAPRMPGGGAPKEIAIYAWIVSYRMDCIFDFSQQKTQWAQGLLTGEYIQIDTSHAVALKPGKYLCKNKYTSFVVECDAGETIWNFNNNAADFWVIIKL